MDVLLWFFLCFHYFDLDLISVPLDELQNLMTVLQADILPRRQAPELFVCLILEILFLDKNRATRSYGSRSFLCLFGEKWDVVALCFREILNY